MTASKELIDLSDDELEEMADTADVEKETIQQSIQQSAADETFHKHKSHTQTTNTLSWNRFKTGVLAVLNILFLFDSTYPHKGTVTEFEFKPGIETINLTIEPIGADSDVATAKFTLDTETGRKRLDRLLNYLGLDKPSDLDGATVPVQVYARERLNDNYNLDEPPAAPGKHPLFLLRRLCCRFNLVFPSANTGNDEPNRRCLLALSISLFLTGGILHVAATYLPTEILMNTASAFSLIVLAIAVAAGVGYVSIVGQRTAEAIGQRLFAPNK